MRLNKAQAQSLKRIWQRDQAANFSYLQFRRTVQPQFYDDAIMVKSGNIWIGIETDGYAHS